MALNRLTLTGFRNHKSLDLSLDSNFIVIFGPNGAGKTNILESISLLAPGKGFRNASTEEIFSKNNESLREWVVSALIPYDNDNIILTTGSKIDTYPNVSRRIIKINDELLTKSAELLSYLKIIWITPQTDRLFLDSPAARRKFIDRVTYNFFPLHAANIINYDKLVKSRLKVIQQPKFDEMWVSALEKQLAELNYQIYKNRTNCLGMIKEAISTNTNQFLKPNIRLVGSMDNFINTLTGDEVLHIEEKLKSNRRIDVLSGRTNFGIHKTDLEAHHPIKQIKADQCSTGEQKAMLISIILAQISALKQLTSTQVVLLLDEVFSHLDKSFRYNLIEELNALNTQVWITTANDQIIDEINYPKNVITF